MLRYIDKAIVFQEVPDEITLALEITNCPHTCKNCHSPQLREDIGVVLTNEELENLIKANPDITCVCLMGGDSDHQDILRIAYIVHLHKLKLAFYSGDDKIDWTLLRHLDYYKIGPYIEEKGPLTSKTTNQIMYKINKNVIETITYKFWK